MLRIKTHHFLCSLKIGYADFFSWKKQFLKYVSRRGFTPTLSLLGKKKQKILETKVKQLLELFSEILIIFSLARLRIDKRKNNQRRVFG